MDDVWSDNLLSFPPEHNIAVRSKYLHVPNLRSLQACVSLTVKMNPIKKNSQRAQLEQYFLGCVSSLLPLNSVQSNVHVQAHAGEPTYNLLPPMELHARRARTHNRLPPIISRYQSYM